MRLKSSHYAIKISLIVASTLFIIGVWGARSRPASSYELSIYSATPNIFWIAVGIIFILTVYSTLVATSLHRTSLFLASLAIITVAALPLIRGYYFVSEWDAMTHLGILYDIRSGSQSIIDIFYPLAHTISASFTYILDIQPEQSIILTTLLFVISFIVSVPLVVRQFYPNRAAVSIGIFSALLLLPLGRNGIHFAPNLLAILFSPFFIAALVYTIRSKEWRQILIFLIIFITSLLLHPQVTIVLFLGVVGMLGITLAILPLTSSFELNRLFRHLFLLVILSGIIIFARIGSTNEFATSFRLLVLGLFESSPGSDSASLSVSLEEVGGSVLEIAVKLFSHRFIYVVVATCYIALSLRYVWPQVQSDSLEMYRDYRAQLLLISTGLIPMVFLFIVSFVASRYYMRYFSVAMGLTTIIGAIGIASIFNFNRRSFQVGAVLILLVLLLSSVLVVYPSPYIYQANTHVSEGQVNGYDTALEYSAEDIDFVRVRSPVYRYQHATEGVADSDRREYTGRYLATTPDHFANQNLPEYYDQRKYLAITATDRQRDPIAYGGFRYSTDDFNYLEHDQQIDKIVTSGQFDLYRVW